MAINNIVFDETNIKEAISNRQKYKHGYLRIDNNILSSAIVSPYYGREIPNHKQLGLDENRIYNVLRDPIELQKSVPTFEGIPLADAHIVMDSRTVPAENKIGAVGTNLQYKNIDMIGTIIVHDQRAIDLIEHPDVNQRVTGLSCSYEYEPVLEKGIYNGVPYDLKMTNIVGNHVALVKQGRVPNALVADSNINLKGKKMNFKNVIKAFFAKDERISDDDIAKAMMDIARSDASEEEKTEQIKALLNKRDGDADNAIPNSSTNPLGGNDEDKREDDRDARRDDRREKDRKDRDDRDAKRDDKKEDRKDRDDDEDDEDDRKDDIIDTDKFERKIEATVRRVLKDLHDAAEREDRKEDKAMDSALNLYRTVLGEPNINAFNGKSENVYNAILRAKNMAADGKTVDEKRIMAETLVTYTSKAPVFDSNSVTKRTNRLADMEEIKKSFRRTI